MESNFNYKNFSIVIPIYNEEEILEESTNAIFSLCKRMGIDFEIIFSKFLEFFFHNSHPQKFEER